MTQVMGILNATPDSFSDGGDLDNPEVLRRRIQDMLDANVDIIDVGGESTRPGHTPVPADIEIARVRPVIRAIRALDDLVPISIDTSKAEVADAALRAGATAVNDVRGLQDPRMAEVVLQHRCPLIVMRDDDLEGDVVEACRNSLDVLIGRTRQAGIPDGWVTLDPGLGFGERPGPHVEDNLQLLDSIQEYAQGFNVLIGHSRKRFVRHMAEEGGLDVDAMTAELSKRAAEAGAAIVRVHDVAATKAALQP